MLATGDIIDRYEVLHEVGRGGAAVVYAVVHTVLGTRHALKVPRGAAAFDAPRLVREGRLQAHLSPTHVVPITDVLDVDGVPGLLMPLVEGCSLADLLDEYRPTESEVASLILGVLAGVDAAHRAEVVHRDLKPANVLLELRRGRVVARVTDFGIALVQGAPGSPGFRGTPAYAAPEQILDADGVTASADLWSVGVMCFELLTGRRPFTQSTLSELVSAQRAGAWDRHRVPATWAPLVKALLQVEPTERPEGAGDVAKAVRALGIAAPIPGASRLGNAVAPSAGPSAPLWTHGATVPEARWPDHNLRRPVGELVGRQPALSTLDTVLQDHRLVTLVGPAGVGKSRMGAELAWHQREHWPGGVWAVDLGAATTEPDVLGAVAQALGVPLGAHPREELHGVLAGMGRTLLVLDPADRVGDALLELITGWLDHAAGLTLLVIGQSVLGLASERVLPVPPLDAEPAAALFVARARAALGTFEPTHAQRTTIDALVAQLDGLPLAIELAAPRLRVLELDQLLDRLEDRFRLLRSAGTEGHARSLQAVLDSSVQRASGPEQAMLQQLSVFCGGFDLDDLESVVELTPSDWPLDVLQGLVDRSLVQRRGASGFGLLASIRDHAAQGLGAAARAALEERHGAHLATFGTPEALAGLHQRGGAELRASLRGRRADLVAACRGALQRCDAPTAAATALAAWAVHEADGPYAEGLALLTDVLELQDLSDIARLRVSGRAAFASQLMGDYAASRRQHEATLALARSSVPEAVPEALGDLAGLELHTGHPERARECCEEAVALRGADDPGLQALLARLDTEQGDAAAGRRGYLAAAQGHRDAGNVWSENYVWLNLAMLAFTQGRLPEAHEAAAHALSGFTEVSDRRGEGTIRGILGQIHLRRGQLDEARAFLESARALHRRLGRRGLQAVVTQHLGELALRTGDVATARAQLERAMELQRVLGNRRSEAISARALGKLLTLQGHYEAASTLLRDALAADREVGNRRGELHGHLALAELARARGDLGDVEREASRALEMARAAEHRWNEAVALTLLTWARPALRPGVFDEAIAQHRAAGNERGEGLAWLAKAWHLHSTPQEALVSLDEAERLLRAQGAREPWARAVALRARLLPSHPDAHQQATAEAQRLHVTDDSELARNLVSPRRSP